MDIPSLLITDDDDAFRETLREVFEPRGYRTLLASDGTEALDLVQQEEVHLALFDLHMPRLGGLEAVERIRQLDLAVPWILMSADLDDEVRERAAKASVFDVLAKPFTFRQVTLSVTRALSASYGWNAGN